MSVVIDSSISIDRSVEDRFQLLSAITGFGESDVVSFEMAADIGEDTLGADGEVTFSRNNDDRVYATITCYESSKGYQQLAAIMQTQIAAVGAIPPLSFLMQDSINGDQINDSQCMFKSRPGPSKAKGVSERAFQVLLPNAAKSIKYGSKIAI